MKAVHLGFALLATLSSVPALAIGYSCDGMNVLNQYVAVDAAVIDVGDQEGELFLHLPSGTKEYKGYAGVYATPRGKIHAVFTMMLDADREFTLDLNELGREGVLTLPNETIKVTCDGPYPMMARYAIRAAKSARKYGYGFWGVDSNSLKFVTASKPANALDPEAIPVSGSSLHAALAECVFVRQGGYGGDHISTSSQNKLISLFKNDMLSVAKSERETLRFYRSKKLLANSDTLDRPTCSLLMEVTVAGYPELTTTMALNATLSD